MTAAGGRPATRLVCSACGAVPEADDPYPFRCPRAGGDGDVDHVLVRELDLEAVRGEGGLGEMLADPEPNSFIRFRRLLHAWNTARDRGLADREWVEMVRDLDGRVASVDGHGFRTTPYAAAPALAGALDLEPQALWVKDETGNVSGSHKGRHLMGLMVWLATARRIGLLDPARSEPPLAIASCGNAALAAAVVARAAERPLEVYVPPDADPAVVERLAALEAEIVPCPRRTGEAGDPCYHRFHEALDRGALPFGVQGPDNGLTVEGGMTLAWELAASGGPLDRLFVQVGGGALAAACVQGLSEARDLGWLERMPRVFTVQTEGAWPLKRAYDRVSGAVLARRFRESPDADPAPLDETARAEFLHTRVPAETVNAELEHAARHRGGFMWPWESEPRSVAHGILDDETYDWRAVVAGMIRSGGRPLVVSEDTLLEANALAREHTGIPVDPTGTAGLAGLMHLVQDLGAAAGGASAVLFTGRIR